jgi:signal transduction histidine kinase/CheY-like chemotaxis protein
MKIRSQLTLLVAVVVVPVAVLAASMTGWLWRLQHQAYEQRYLERVSALRLALDAHLESTTRVLAALSASEDLTAPGRLPQFANRFDRLLAVNPSWSTIGLTDAAGRIVAVRTRIGLRSIPPPPLEPGVATGPFFSNLLPIGDGAFVTYVSVPILRDGAFGGSVYIGIGSDGWLDFLRSYPISPKATLTVNDRAGLVIARTLNNERWVGKRSGASFWDRTAGRDEGSFEGRGLEGQSFYAAFSRSRASGWVLGTGVPSEEVEAELRDSTIGIIAAVVGTAIAVALFAVSVGARIIAAIQSLESTARHIGTSPPAGSDGPLPIEEVETVRLALRQAGDLLAAREAERAAAFAREADARAEAERSNAAKDEFLAMLGHELRNPLSAMKSASTLLGTPSVHADVHARSRKVIDRQIGRLTDLVDDMLDVARLNSGKIVLDRRIVDMAEVVRHVVASFADAGRCLHLRVETALAPAWVFADETRLEQIVSNLLDNACKYTPPGGRVRIETSTGEDGATLTVSDDGSGIAPELLPRIFDVFAQGERTLERAQGGLGLGLTVVRRLVALHGGSIVAESAGMGRGASFRMRLPQATPDDRDVAQLPAAPPLAPMRIVIVEDNEDNREGLSLLLSLQGHAVVAAVGDGDSGAEAILREAPDVAIVDLGLPVLDGFGVATRVRAAPGGGRPLLFALTGYGAPEDRQRALAAGFDGFFIKPFDFADFASAVATAMDKRSTG